MVNQLCLRSRSWRWSPWILCLLAASVWANDPASSEVRQADVDKHVGALIEQLGAPEYSTREKAQATLQRMGLSAFDALYDAMQHDDIEVARRARYLVRSMPIRWSLDADTPEVKNVLRGYGDRPNLDRRSRMDRLALLRDDQGVAPLCRLARFETDHVLSKHAALLVMNLAMPEGDAERGARATAIRDTLGSSRRPAADWLRALAETLDSTQPPWERWDQLVRSELEVLTQFPEKSDPAVVRDLMRWQADQLWRIHRESEAEEVVRRSLELLAGEREDLVEAVDWLLNRKLWGLVEELAQRFGTKFDDDLELLYSLAQAQRYQKKPELANQTAEHARALVATPYLHVRQGMALQERGIVDWAEQEYRRVFELAPIGDPLDLQARRLLSEMLHDIGKDLPAAQVLQQMSDAAAKDASIAKLISQNLTDTRAWLARMQYFYALHYGESGDRAKQREYLEKAVKEYPLELDALIAMHHFPDADEAWREQSRQKIRAAAEKLGSEIRQLEKQVDQPLNEAAQSDSKGELAQKCNEYAWLVANTDGDYAEALRCSLRSLELVPGSAAYLDTLGRCYFANRDYKNAIRYQSQAIQLEPHSSQMRRQLEIFRKALEDSQAERKQ